MTLAESLDIQAGEMVSFIGAGGKTTTLFSPCQGTTSKGRQNTGHDNDEGL
jgi:hypothetical protein